MAKKKKDKKKGAGMEKTLKKEEKKAQKKTQAEGDDIDGILNEFRVKDASRSVVSIESSPPPSARSNASFLAHPTEDKLVVFGGQFFDGLKAVTYNDLFQYNTAKNEWKAIKAPNAPLPRHTHQACITNRAGGQMWVFGGEFTSPKEDFRHYNDLWLLHLDSWKWEKVEAKGGPSARSGHRMVAHKSNLFVFGGYYDNTRFTKYYNDLYVFDMNNMTWNKVKEIPGQWPSERAGFNFEVYEEGDCAFLYGGMVEEKAGKEDKVGDFTKSVVLDDLWSLNFTNLTWNKLKKKGVVPTPRSSVASTTHGNRLLMFGGVLDKETKYDLTGEFFADLYALNMEAARFSLIYSPNPGPSTTSGTSSSSSSSSSSTTTNTATSTVSTFLMDFPPPSDTVAVEKDEKEKKEKTKKPVKDAEKDKEQEKEKAEKEKTEKAKKAKEKLAKEKEKEKEKEKDKEKDKEKEKEKEKDDKEKEKDKEDKEDKFLPSLALTDAPAPRRSAKLAVKGNTLWMWGGVFEHKSRFITLTDLWSYDLKKHSWALHQALDKSSLEWYGSDEEEEEEEEEEDDNADEGDEDQEEGKKKKQKPKDKCKTKEKEDKKESKGKEEEQEDDVEEEEEDEGDEGEEEDADKTAKGPKPNKNETLKDFFQRTQTHWMEVAAAAVATMAAEDQKMGKDKLVRKKAFEMASEVFNNK